jgi:hypothetical protein
VARAAVRRLPVGGMGQRTKKKGGKRKPAGKRGGSAAGPGPEQPPLAGAGAVAGAAGAGAGSYLDIEEAPPGEGELRFGWAGAGALIRIRSHLSTAIHFAAPRWDRRRLPARGGAQRQHLSGRQFTLFAPLRPVTSSTGSARPGTWRRPSESCARPRARLALDVTAIQKSFRRRLVCSIRDSPHKCPARRLMAPPSAARDDPGRARGGGGGAGGDGGGLGGRGHRLRGPAAGLRRARAALGPGAPPVPCTFSSATLRTVRRAQGART